MSRRRDWLDTVATLGNIVAFVIMGGGFATAYVVTGIRFYFWLTLLFMIAFGFCFGSWLAARIDRAR
jgi:hypothetical protein